MQDGYGKSQPNEFDHMQHNCHLLGKASGIACICYKVSLSVFIKSNRRKSLICAQIQYKQ